MKYANCLTRVCLRNDIGSQGWRNDAGGEQTNKDNFYGQLPEFWTHATQTRVFEVIPEMWSCDHKRRVPCPNGKFIKLVTLMCQGVMPISMGIQPGAPAIKPSSNHQILAPKSRYFAGDFKCRQWTGSVGLEGTAMEVTLESEGCRITSSSKRLENIRSWFWKITSLSGELGFWGLHRLLSTLLCCLKLWMMLLSGDYCALVLLNTRDQRKSEPETPIIEVGLETVVSGFHFPFQSIE